jgi:hypothetical protein
VGGHAGNQQAIDAGAAACLEDMRGMLCVQNIPLLLHVVTTFLYCSTTDTSKDLQACALAAAGAAGVAASTHTATSTRSFTAIIVQW